VVAPTYDERSRQSPDDRGVLPDYRRQFGIAPATALTHLATEPEVPAALLDPFVELGIRVVR
jgi:hypothetical protein